MANAIVDRVAVAVQPWSDLYAGSIALSSAVEFLHLAGLLVAGGLALSFDRAALRLRSRTSAERTRFAVELAAVHRPVLIALSLVIASGLALALADAATMLGSWLFWAKMAGFGLLMVNGLLLRRSGGRLMRDPKSAPAWRSIERAATRSMALWITIVFLGVVLTNAA
jgi:hypothetical protein